MVPATHDLTIYRDRDFSQTFYLKSHGAAMDLTGYSAKAEIRSGKDTDELIVGFLVVVDPLIGSITISLEDNQTILLVNTVAFWDLVLTDTYGLRQNYIEGMVNVLGTVTREADPGGIDIT